jgi:uncharacterized protein (DUF1684 family)
MKAPWMFLTAAVVQLCLLGCNNRTQDIDPVSYRTYVEQWRGKRLTRLTSESGWLTLCGLFWLKEGPNRCGTDSSNDIIFPAGKSPSVVGTFWLSDTLVRFEALPGVEVRHTDSTATSVALLADTDEGGPTILKFRTLSFYLIKRGDKIGVRVKDTENPTRLNFKGLEYFPIDLKWRFRARLDPYAPPRIVKITNAVNTVQDYTSPGALVFEHDGNTIRLDAFVEASDAKELLVMFSDETSGVETYGAGRQLYTGMPDSNGMVVLDFNLAYNWPCVFTEFATCPLPPPENQLPFRVEAGEKMYTGHE